MSGRSRERPALAEQPLPLTARLSVLPCRGGEGFLRRLFEPLGYTVQASRHTLDETVPEWGDSRYFSVVLEGQKRLSEFEGLPAGRFRHKDHRFEWTRAEFEAWARGVAERFGYGVRFAPVGEVDAEVGAPTQMAVFSR